MALKSTEEQKYRQVLIVREVLRHIRGQEERLHAIKLLTDRGCKKPKQQSPDTAGAIKDLLGSMLHDYPLTEALANDYNSRIEAKAAARQVIADFWPEFRKAEKAVKYNPGRHDDDRRKEYSIRVREKQSLYEGDGTPGGENAVRALEDQPTEMDKTFLNGDNNDITRVR